MLGTKIEIWLESTPGCKTFHVGVVKQQGGWSFAVSEIILTRAYGKVGDQVEKKEKIQSYMRAVQLHFHIQCMNSFLLMVQI